MPPSKDNQGMPHTGTDPSNKGKRTKKPTMTRDQKIMKLLNFMYAVRKTDKKEIFSKLPSDIKDAPILDQMVKAQYLTRQLDDDGKDVRYSITNKGIKTLEYLLSLDEDVPIFDFLKAVKAKKDEQSEYDDMLKEIMCCDNADCVLVTERNPSESRFTESYKCKNCKTTVVYYIKLERYERYDKNGNIEYERNLTT
tara:strand:- start:332 stop:919 length:588 start_codon:yes stop_codon:yes gene_type:complete